jgi:hypothetical protein
MYSGLVAALLVSLLLTLASVFLLRRKGPWGSAWTFFLILFLALWLVSIYISPVGPIYVGVAWAPLIIAGILVTTLLIASMPSANDWRDESIKSEETKSQHSSRPMGRIFWILIILLAMSIMIGMMNPQKAL